MLITSGNKRVKFLSYPVITPITSSVKAAGNQPDLRRKKKESYFITNPYQKVGRLRVLKISKHYN